MQVSKENSCWKSVLLLKKQTYFKNITYWSDGWVEETKEKLNERDIETDFEENIDKIETKNKNTMEWAKEHVILMKRQKKKEKDYLKRSMR